MAKNPEHLNQKQVDVLAWIDDGCPVGVYEQGYEHRIIARALERRGLVSIQGRGPSWSVTITDSGRAWKSAPPTNIEPDESEADQLITRVLEADGHLLLADDREEEKALARLVRMSLRSPNRPKGKKLEMRGTGQWGHGPKEIIFVEHFDDHVEVSPMIVPARTAKYHPAVKSFLADKERQFVTKEHVPRAARILHAIAHEAPRRGLELLTTEQALKGIDDHRARDVRRGHLALRTPAGIYGLTIREVPGPGGRKMERRRWNERKTQPAWLEGRGWEFISTGKLELIVRGPDADYNGDRYRDAKSVTLEDKLPEVFRSFEIHKLRAEWRAQEQERKKTERRSRWEAAMTDARARYAEHARWEHFKQRSHQWHAVEQHREFLEAARAAAATYDSDDRDALVAQLDAAERTLNGLDPIQRVEHLLPDLAEPKPEDLKPFLNGWSPYGPDGR
ncbi:hypothetical protein [Agromyces bauzanensis]